MGCSCRALRTAWMLSTTRVASTRGSTSAERSELSGKGIGHLWRRFDRCDGSCERPAIHHGGPRACPHPDGNGALLTNVWVDREPDLNEGARRPEYDPRSEDRASQAHTHAASSTHRAPAAGGPD